RELRSPTEVVRALAYVLMNSLHNFPDAATRLAQDVRGPFSSAWREAGTDRPVVPARTWLLSLGWRRSAGKVLLLLVSDAAPAPAGRYGDVYRVDSESCGSTIFVTSSAPGLHRP